MPTETNKKFHVGDTVEILSSSENYPEGELSNFSNFPFCIDGVRCGGMEGFLQSLKFISKRRQREVAALFGKAAKHKGENKLLWKLTGIVFWQGKPYRRSGAAFTSLIGRAYDELFSSSPEFREALGATERKPLSHSIGKSKKRQTILTESEFISNLLRLREKL